MKSRVQSMATIWNLLLVAHLADVRSLSPVGEDQDRFHRCVSRRVHTVRIR
jgi:hypothetical protein